MDIFIIIFAVLAVFIVLRPRSVIGLRRAGWWKQAEPLDGLLRDQPSQRKADEQINRLFDTKDS